MAITMNSMQSETEEGDDVHTTDKSLKAGGSLPTVMPKGDHRAVETTIWISIRKKTAGREVCDI